MKDSSLALFFSLFCFGVTPSFQSHFWDSVEQKGFWSTTNISSLHITMNDKACHTYSCDYPPYLLILVLDGFRYPVFFPIGTNIFLFKEPQHCSITRGLLDLGMPLASPTSHKLFHKNSGKQWEVMDRTLNLDKGDCVQILIVYEVHWGILSSHWINPISQSSSIWILK